MSDLTPSESEQPNNPVGQEVSPKPPRQIFRGMEVLEITRQITTALSKENPLLSQALFHGIGSSVNNFIESMRVARGSDYYMTMVVDQERNYHFIREGMKEGDHDREVKGEFVERLMDNFALTRSENNFILVGGAKEYTDEEIGKIADEIETIEKRVIDEMNVPIRKKVCLVYDEEFFEYEHEPRVFAAPTRSYIELGIEGGKPFIGDGSFDPRVRGTYAWVLTDFYQAVYEQRFHNFDVEYNPFYLRLEKRGERLRRLREMGAPPVILDGEAKLFREGVGEFLEEEGISGKVSIEDTVEDIEKHNFDYSKVPAIAPYKEAYDWWIIYSRSLPKMIEVLTSDEEQKFSQEVQERVREYGQFNNPEELYKLIADKTGKYRNDVAQFNMAWKFFPSFLLHLRNKYRIKTPEIARAASMMDRTRYSPEEFCKELNLDYTEVSSSWIQSLKQ